MPVMAQMAPATPPELRAQVILLFVVSVLLLISAAPKVALSWSHWTYALPVFVWVELCVLIVPAATSTVPIEPKGRV